MDGVVEDPRQVAVRRLLDQALSQTLEDLGAHAGGIYLVEPDGEIVSLEVNLGVPPDFVRPLVRLRLTAPITDPVVEAIRERHLVWIPSGEEHMRRYPKPARVLPHPLTIAVAPIATGDTAWGAMVLFWPRGRSPELGVYERHSISVASDLIAGLLHSAAEAGHRLLPSPAPRYLPPTHRDETHPAVHFATRLPEGACSLTLDGRIAFVDRTAALLLGESVPVLLGARLWEAVPWLADPVYEHRHRDAVISQQPTSFTAVRPPGRCLLFQLYPDPTGISVRISPTQEEQRPEELASVDAGYLAGPTRLGAIYHLMHLAGALTRAKTVSDVVDLLADRFLPAFQAQAFVLLVPETGRVRVIGHRGFGAELLSSVDHLPLTSVVSPSVLGLTTGVPFFFGSRDELRAAHPASADIDDRTAAWAVLPLIASGQPIGTCLLGYDQPHRFTREERITLTSLSAMLAQALDRARLYDAQYQIAHGLQASLLPHTLPEVPGLDVAARYLPASHGIDVGGDFYDLFRTGPTDVAAVIGDVQGHNVRAAALMGQVRTAIHAYVAAGATPGEILARTNRLLSYLDPELLASCLYAHLDLTHHRAHLATAGHCPPLLRRPDLHTETLDLPTGPLLGADATATYPTTDIALSPGSVLAFYTDGLIETPGTSSDSNLAALREVLSHADHSLDDIADAMLNQAQPSGARADDTALLLLRIQPDIPEHAGLTSTRV